MGDTTATGGNVLGGTKSGSAQGVCPGGDNICSPCCLESGMSIHSRAFRFFSLVPLQKQRQDLLILPVYGLEHFGIVQQLDPAIHIGLLLSLQRVKLLAQHI
jgi:hypothetical protein